MAPTIKVEFKGNTFNCCNSSTDKKYCRVAFRADKGIFVALLPEHPSKNPIATAATLAAIERRIKDKYQVDIKSLPLKLSDEELPSLHEVETIELLAKGAFRRSQDRDSPTV